MQTHVVQLTKQRLSDFFVKEDGHVAHKNALAAGTVAAGAILASLMLTPDALACDTISCGDGYCSTDEWTGCCSGTNQGGHLEHWCC
ncbi:MAG: hypothetical protein OXN25_09815 [Candidatus Poribacteria bacterium]|nr:hypothetical protein [Candidatus Poribacteria bacterium]MYK20288.1 hypothetical protein [Candidatus Poribacteria bacterium]